jgi:hypothetical protein
LRAGYVETIPGLTLQSDWLLGEEGPFLDLLLALLASTDTA